MPISFDRALGIHENTLYLRSKRTAILASNMANADTPNYKARDIDFSRMLSRVNHMSSGLKSTHANHMQPKNSLGTGAYLRYRTPMQPSLDGNTVDGNLEQARFAENALMYQTNLRFLDGKFKGMIKALRGE